MVRGLQTYLERNCPNACISTDIKSLVSKYKADNNVSDAVIVMNLRSLMRGFTYANDNTWMFGGQLKELVESTLNFAKAFEKIGAKLVFFDGYVTERKFPIWLERRKEGLLCAEKTLEAMDDGSPIRSFEGCQRLIPTFFVDLAKYVFKNVSKCEVFTPPRGRECDEAVADYARDNKCFAILGVDSDYVIYNAAKYYLTLRHLDMESMKTLRYDSEMLAKQLGCPVECLPLFASLVGNDVISKDDLTRFHEYIGKTQSRRKQTYYPSRVIMKGVGEYAGQYNNMDAVFRNLPKIARQVFGAANMESVIEAALWSYLPGADVDKDEILDSEWEDIKSEGMRRLAEGKMFKDVLPAITDGLTKFGAMLESARHDDLPQSTSVTLALRRRFYGVVLFDKPDEPRAVEEWCRLSVEVRDKRDMVEPILPGQDLHPGLLALWDEERTDIADKRWALFAHSVSPNLTGEQLRALPPILVVPAAILFYLRAHIPVVADKDSGYLEEWELKALAIQAVLVETTTLEEISAIRIEPPYNTRAIRLASIFMRAVTQMLILLAACGFPIPMEQAMPWHYFDGKLFHQTYKKILAGEKCEQLAGDKVPLCEQLCELVLQAQAE